MRISLLTYEKMMKLNTQRLLAYKNKLLTVRDTEICWCGDIGCTNDDIEDSLILTKSHPTWIEVYGNAKAILKTREHVDRKKK